MKRLVTLALFFAAMATPAAAQQEDPTAKFTDNPKPGLFGRAGDYGKTTRVDSGERRPGRRGGESGPYSYFDIRAKDFYLNRPCAPDSVIGEIEVWLVTGPPHEENFQYYDLECMPIDWWLDQVGPEQIPELDQVSAQAIIREHLPIPSVALNPDAHGITGLEVWLWYEDDGTTGLTPIDHDGNPSTPAKPGLTVSDSEGPYSISATVWIDRFTWDMGDGTVLVADHPGSEDRPAARHTYRTKNPDYHVTTSVVWRGRYSWSAGPVGGSDLDMGSLTVASDPRPYPVHEVRSVPADR